MATAMRKASALLIEARTRADLTQAELARLARIPRSVLNAYERGRREPGADRLNEVLRAAGFQLTIKPTIDLERNARKLVEAIEQLERLPYKPKRKLEYPPFLERIRESKKG